LHECFEGPLQEVPGPSDTRVANFTVGDRHRLLRD
jgi:hypothetical protein